MWVNVATSAGDIDYWGEYAQIDHDEFQISYDEYDFVVFHMTTGPGPGPVSQGVNFLFLLASPAGLLILWKRFYHCCRLSSDRK